jgi:hypothetical protein
LFRDVAQQLVTAQMVNRIFPAAGSADSLGAVVYKGRCSARPDRAKDLGDLIMQCACSSGVSQFSSNARSSEVQQAAANDPYLLRTLLRSAILRTLSVFLTRLEALMTVTATADAPQSWTPKSARDLLPPADRRFDFDIVKTAYELKAALQRACGSEVVPAFARDALNTWVVNLEAIVNKIMNPFLLEIKKEVAVTIGRARSTLDRVSSGQTLASPALGAKAPAAVEGPAYLQDVAAQLDGTKKFLTGVLACGQEETDRWIVSIATHLTWKGMLAYAARPCPVDDLDLHSKPAPARPVKKPSILSPKSGKRSPSPPAGSPRKTAASRLVDEITAFRTVIIHFTHDVLPGLVRPHTPAALQAMATAANVQALCEAFDLLPELDADEEGMALTQEAMHEALLALSSFELTVRALRWPDELKIAFLYDDEDSSSSSDSDEDGVGGKRLTPSTVFNLIGPSSPASRVAAEKARSPTAHRPSRVVPIKLPCQTLDRALETLPPLITFHLLVSRLPMARNYAFRLPHEIWQLAGGWDDYTAQLTGFATGESFAEEVGWQMVAELDRLKTEGPEGVFEDLLRVAVASEVGIQAI